MMRLATFFILIPLVSYQCSRIRVDSFQRIQTQEGNSPDSVTHSVSGNPFTLKGRIMVSGNYCGGAAPSREMMEEVRRPKPKVGMRVIAHPTGNYKTDTDLEEWVGQTDGDGYWELKLYPGEYCLKVGAKADTNPIVPESKPGWVVVDADCYTQWLGTCDLTFRVDTEGNVDGSLDILLYDKCFVEGYDPCSVYMGPKPP